MCSGDPRVARLRSTARRADRPLLRSSPQASLDHQNYSDVVRSQLKRAIVPGPWHWPRSSLAMRLEKKGPSGHGLQDDRGRGAHSGCRTASHHRHVLGTLVQLASVEHGLSSRPTTGACRRVCSTPRSWVAVAALRGRPGNLVTAPVLVRAAPVASPVRLAQTCQV